MVFKDNIFFFQRRAVLIFQIKRERREKEIIKCKKLKESLEAFIYTDAQTIVFHLKSFFVTIE